MLEKTAKILFIFLILGNGGFSTNTGGILHLQVDSNANIEYHSIIHRRSAPLINIPLNGRDREASDQADKKLEGGKNMNNSNSEVLQAKDKNNVTSTEVQAQNISISKSDTKYVNVSSTMPEVPTTESSNTQIVIKGTTTVKPTEIANVPNEQQTSETKDIKEKANVKVNSTKTEQSSNLKPMDKDKDQITNTKVPEINNSTTANTTKITNMTSTEVHMSNKNDANSSASEAKNANWFNSTAAMEQDDMIHSHVTPLDNDDAITAAKPNVEQSTEIVESKNKAVDGNLTTFLLPPEVFPQGKNVKSIDNADPEVRARLNRTMYHTAEAENTGTLKKTPNGKSISSGIIALVTTITFAIVIVIAYISMIAWRRYLERKYGRRELLVNELEFDTNDLRHFEL